MPDYTDNHRYQLFTDTEEPWEHRTDFQSLDTDVEIRDQAANLDEYTPKTNAKFLAVDTGDVYIGNGDEWSPLALSAGSSSVERLQINGYPTIAQTTDDIVCNDGERFDPADYGDFGLAFNAAIDHVRQYTGNADSPPSSPGAAIYLPPTQVDYSETMVIDDMVQLTVIGAGMQATCPRYRGSGSALEIRNGLVMSYLGNFKLVGNRNADDLFRWVLDSRDAGCRHNRIQNIALTNTGRHGIHEDFFIADDSDAPGDLFDTHYDYVLARQIGGDVFHSDARDFYYGAAERTIRNMECEEGVEGNFIYDYGGGVMRRFYDCIAEHPNGNGYVIGDGGDCIMVACKSEGAGGHGFQFNTAELGLYNCRAYANDGYGYHFDGYFKNATISMIDSQQNRMGGVYFETKDWIPESDTWGVTVVNWNITDGITGEEFIENNLSAPYVTYRPTSEPAAPREGQRLFVDEIDGRLKSRSSDGTTYII